MFIQSSEEKRRNNQRLIKFDTYGFLYWMEKEFDILENHILCSKRDVELSLSEFNYINDSNLGPCYITEDYLVIIGDYKGLYGKDRFEKVYKKYQLST